VIIVIYDLLESYSVSLSVKQWYVVVRYMQIECPLYILGCDSNVVLVRWKSGGAQLRKETPNRQPEGLERLFCIRFMLSKSNM
jgi:hypothetical protein